MRYIVTGADGQLAGRVAENMLNQVDGSQLTFTCYKLNRVPADKKDRWTKAGVRIVEANYDDPESLEKAFKGGDRLYLVSGLAVGKRVQQHKNAIDAAIKDGVSHITYSSFVGATDPKYDAAYVTPDHTATENYLKQTGVAYNAARNNLYLENYLTIYPMLAFMSNNRWLSAAKNGKATLVAKDDAAEAAAALLLGKGEDNKAYNITGSQAISVGEIAQLISKASGTDIEYVPTDREGFFEYADKLHIPRLVTGDFSRSPIPFCAEDGVSNDENIAKGLMNVKSNSIEELTGHKARTAADIVDNYSYIWEDHITSWLQMK